MQGVKFNVGKHKKRKAEGLLLTELYKKVQQLEKAVDILTEKSTAYNINIEKLDVQKLENLTFHLDSLDIDELSGSLNIGNNFGLKQEKDFSGIFRSKNRAVSKVNKKVKTASPDKKEASGDPEDNNEKN